MAIEHVVVECAYCGFEVPIWPEETRPPAVDNDVAWEEEASHHAHDCEWIATRAHRREDRCKGCGLSVPLSAGGGVKRGR